MTARTALRLALVALATLPTLAFGSPATGAGADGGIDIDHVEVADDGTVSVLLGLDALSNGAVPELSGLSVTLDQEPVDSTAETVKAGEVRRTTVLAIDASDSMRGSRISAAKAAALAFLDAAPADVQIGLLTFSNRVQDVIAPTTDHDALATAIRSIGLTRGTHVYDAIKSAVALSGDEGARSVLLLSDGRDQGGRTELDDAVSAATEAEVVVDVVALDQGVQERALMGQVADASGGDVIEAADPADLERVFTAQADALAHQVLVRFARPAGIAQEAQVEVSLAAGEETWTDAAFVPLGTASDSSSGPATLPHKDPLVGRIALPLGIAALGLGLTGLLAVVLVGRRGPSAAQKHLATYFGEAGGDATSAGDGLRASAVSVAEKAVKGDFGDRLGQRLLGAAVALTPAEWILLQAGVTVIAGLLGLALGGAVLMVLGLAAGAAGPSVYLRLKHKRRLRAFGAQLPETLTLIAGGLSAGLSLLQAVDTVVQEGQEPMAGELRRALVEQRLGVEIEDALEDVAERMGSEDFGWVVMAIRIQREVGGNLAEILTTVSDTLREREYLRRQVRTLSAEGRVSAWILGFLPVAMFGYMLIGNRDFVRPLYTEALGWLFLTGAAVLLALGVFVMSRLVKVEV